MACFILSSYFLGIEHPPGYPLFHAYRASLHLLAVRLRRLPRAPGERDVRRLDLRRRLAVRPRADWRAAAGVPRGARLGVSPVFWSQAIIAEVYTLNTFSSCPWSSWGCRPARPSLQGATSAYHSRLCLMALLFGLSLSNHYPLMLLVAPAFVILLWPMRRELLQRFGVLSWLVILGSCLCLDGAPLVDGLANQL